MTAVRVESKIILVESLELMEYLPNITVIRVEVKLITIESLELSN